MSHFSLAILSLVAQSALATSYWQPTAGTPWQIVLSEVLKAPYPSGINAIDGDLYSNDASTWAALKSQGIKTICYFSAGSYEDWRPDADRFVKGVDYGEPLKGWEGEWWVNTKSENVRDIMKTRLDLAQQKGCDAVDPDNMDAYGNGGGGFDLTEDDAVDYITFLSAEAHRRNMAVGLKNAGAIVPRVLDVVEFQVNEQCVEYGECDTFQPFIAANKPVFNIEYTSSDDAVPDQKDVTQICTNTDSKGFSTLIKHMNLNEWLIACNITEAAHGNDNNNNNNDSDNDNVNKNNNNTTGSPNASRTAPSTPVYTGAAGKSTVVGAVSILAVLAAGVAFL